ncbi:hypothetical protein PG997_006090 [Apiospora hydei]|uniref:Protein kinase domain-containing protein n=1 Tax=Apiospora hydei TaxID=1337664 RepID=A0ABR1WMQ3_9PEZI
MAALPRVNGPKLIPFGKSAGERCDIGFIKQLGEGSSGYVWKVRIDGDVYALKMRADVAQFKCPGYDPDHYEELLDFLKQCRDLKEACGYTEADINEEKSQFSRESRAYGRLKECNREDLSVKCYGYIQLDGTNEKELAEKGVYDWSRWDGPKEPVMAIVKEYIEVPDKTQDEVQDGVQEEPLIHCRSWLSENDDEEEDEEEDERRLKEYRFQMHKRSWQNKEHLFQEKDIPQMMEDLHSLHKLGIWVGDIKPENYLHGKIIDFSSSLTMPAFSMDPRIDGPSSSTGGTFDRAELNHVIREYYKYCLPEKENKYEMVIKPRYQTRFPKRTPVFHSRDRPCLLRPLFRWYTTASKERQGWQEQRFEGRGTVGL